MRRATIPLPTWRRVRRGGWRRRIVVMAVCSVTVACLQTTDASAFSITSPTPGAHIAPSTVPTFTVVWEPGGSYQLGYFSILNQYGVSVGGCSALPWVLPPGGATTQCSLASVLPPGVYTWTFLYAFPFCVDDPVSGRICTSVPFRAALGPYLLTVDSPPPPPPPPPAPKPKTIAAAPNLPSSARFTGERSIKDTRLMELVYATFKNVVRKPGVLAVACWTDDDFEAVSGGSVNGDTVKIAFWAPRQPRWLHISGHACADFQQLLDTRVPTGRRASSVVTALHEGLHAYGIRNEAQANCYAVQLVPLAGRNLGMTQAKAAYLGSLALNYTRSTAAAGYWDAAQCRAGGKWDIHLKDVKTPPTGTAPKPQPTPKPEPAA